MSFLGMRGTGDWVADQRPKNWRETILYRYPNGTAPLTAIMSKMRSEKVDDPEFNWWTKSLPNQRAAVTGVYTDTGLSVAYVSGGALGDTVYVKMAAADIAHFRIGHQVLLRDASNLAMDVNAKVVARVANGASSYIGCLLLEADDNSTTDLSDCDVAMVIGNINAEGAAMPDAIAYDPTKWYNFTQIFRTPLEMTRTALRTRLRTGDQYKEAKREALELHSIEMEKAFLWGVSSERTGDNGKPERTTLGIIPAIKGGWNGQTSGGLVNNFPTNTDYTADTWLTSGEHWLDTMLEQLFREGSTERLGLCGSGAILGIQRLLKAKANIQYAMTPQTKAYGIQVIEWVTPFGTISLLRHPLMCQEVTTRNSIILLEPKDIIFRYIDDTTFKADDTMKKGSWTNRDGIKEEYLTEGGLEYHNPSGWAYLTGVGNDNTLSA